MWTQIVIRFLNGCAITIPWMLAAFLGGLALDMWRSEIALTRQYEARLRESHTREDITNQALGLLVDNKFRVNWAKAEAIRRANGEATN